jgi:cation-transporting P-type ATPase 13A2
VLLTGSAIVNEAMLTGESIPVMKSSLPVISSENYSTDTCGKHTLFGGSNVIQTRQVSEDPVFGLVTSTGFLTTKGSLVRDILYPKAIKFKFYQDGMKFVAIMALLAIFGFICTCPIMIKNGTPISSLIHRSLDLITITVPPALPAAMTCGTVFAISRLKKNKIFCISSPRVNLAGRVTTFTFDKTGTLTEDGLSVQGFRCAEKNQAFVEEI